MWYVFGMFLFSVALFAFLGPVVALLILILLVLVAK